MKSKTRINKQTQKKSHKGLVETIFSAKKHDAWMRVASVLSGPRRNRIALNLEQINNMSKEGDIIVVPGKILSQGNIDKKIKVVALSFSDKAKVKLLNSKIPAIILIEEIKKNPNAKNVKIIDIKDKNENN